MERNATNNASVSKKLLSVFLAVLMAFGVFSVCLPNLALSASAAASTDQINALKDALNAYANSGETEKIQISKGSNTVTVSDNTSKGYVYKVLIALQPVLEAERGSYNWFTKMRSRVISLTGATGVSANLLNELVPYLSDTWRQDDNNKNEWYKSNGVGGVSSPGDLISEIGWVTVSVNRSLDSALLVYNTVAEIPESVDLTVNYSVYAQRNRTNETGKQKPWGQWRRVKEWYSFGSAFSLAYSNANTEAAANIKAYYNFFTKVKLDGQTVKTLVDANTIASITAAVNDNAVYSANIAGLSSAVKDHFFVDPTVAAVNTYIEYCARAQQVLLNKEYSDWFKAAIASGYDSGNLDGMNAFYSEATANYNILNGLSAQIKEDMTVCVGTDLAAFAEWMSALKHDIDLYYLRELKKAIDKTDAENPKVADDNVTSLTGEEFLARFPDSEYPNVLISSINGVFNGYVKTLNGYMTSSPDEVNEVFADGTDYVFKFQTNINYIAFEAEAEDAFAPFYEYFIPLIYTSPALYGNTDEAARYTADYSKNAEFAAVYGSYTDKLNADLLRRVFSFYNGDVLVYLPEAVNSYLSAMKADLIARNHKQIQVVYKQAVAAGGTTETIIVNFDNFLGLEKAIKDLDIPLYDYCAYIDANGNPVNPENTNWVSEEDLIVYGKTKDFVDAINKFKASKGLPYDSAKYDVDGVYTIRYAGDQKDSAGNQIGYPSDMARKGAAENYFVTTDKINDTVAKLDKFLTSSDFARLIDFKDKDGNEVENLSAYLETVLKEKVFNNDLVNTIVASLFPMVCKEIGTLVPRIKTMGINGIGYPSDPAAAFSIDIGALAGGNPSGKVDVYMDGTRDTVTVKNLLATLGINVYPTQFAGKLPNTGIYLTIKDALNSCGDKWENLLDEDGNLTFDWGVTDYESFTVAMGNIFNSILSLLQTVLCGKNYSSFVEKLAYGDGKMTYKGKELGIPFSVSPEVGMRINATLSIDGLKIYRDLWIPVMEALGVADNGYTFKSLGENASAAEMVDALFDPLLTLIEQFSASPVEKVANMLPQLLYFLSFDSLQELINSVKINMHVKLSIRDLDKFNVKNCPGWVEDLIKDTVKDAVNDRIPTFDFSLKLADLVDLEDMLGFDYTNINNIVDYVLDSAGLDIPVPLINAGKVIVCSTYDTNASSQRSSGKRLKITANTADVFYTILDFIVGILGDRELIDGILDAVAKDGDKIELPDIVYALIDNIAGNTDNALAAIIELFNPQDYAPMVPDWYRTDKDATIEDKVDLRALAYLAYNTDWTPKKANYLLDNIDEIVKAATGDNAVSVNDKLRAAVDKLFVNKTITALAKELVSFGYTLKNQSVYDLIERETGVDIRQWADAFAYAFPAVTDRYGVTALAPGDDGYTTNFGSVKVTPSVVIDETTGEETTVWTWEKDGKVLADGDREAFFGIFFALAAPMAPIISMIMTGEDVPLFTGALTLKGYEGYSNAVTYLFELLGVKNVMTQAEYNAYVEENGDAQAFEYLVNQLFDRVNEILDGNVIKNLVSMLPNLIYFIESDGLSVVIYNILMPVTTLLDTVRPLVDLDLDKIASVLVSDLLNTGNADIDNILKIISGTYTDNAEYEKWYDIHTKQLCFTEIFRLADIYFGTDIVGSPLVTEGIASIGASPEKYLGASGHDAYRSSCNAADGLTIILSSLLEVVDHASEKTGGKTNGEIICAFIDEKSGNTKASDILELVKSLITGNKPDAEKVNWLYYYSDPDAGELPDITDLADATLPVKTINYLKYSNNWNKPTADSLMSALSGIVDKVLAEKKDTDLAGLLRALLTDNVYTDDVLDSLVEAIVKAVGGIDKALRETVMLMLDIDPDIVNKWFDMCDIDAETGEVTCTREWNINGDREAFTAALEEVLTPVHKLLAWLLFGDSYTFFTSSETDDGGHTLKPIIGLVGNENGYGYGVVPILEALGCKMNAPETYKNADGTTDTAKFVHELLTSVFDRVDELTTGKPLENIIDILPNLVYFINADGVKATVNNLLAPVLGIMTKLSPVIGDASLNDTVGFELDNLTSETIFGIIKDKAGISVSETVKGVIKYLYIGRLDYFESANGEGALNMCYSPNADDEEKTSFRADTVTVLLSVALDILGDPNNSGKFTDMLGEDTYKAIVEILNLTAPELRQDIDWLYTEYADDPDKVFSGLETSNLFDYGYGQFWKKEMAEYIAKYINCFADDLIEFLGIEVDGKQMKSLEDLLNDLVGGTVYTKKNLDKIYSKLSELVAKIDELDEAELIKSAVKSSLGVDLAFYGTYTVPEITDGDRTAFTSALCDIIRPLYPVLKWLLTEEDIAFFTDAEGNDQVVLPGSDGYNDGIIPILEALECDGIKTYAQYAADIEANADAMLTDILNPVFDKIDAILANPATEIFELLPNVAYFINSNGLDSVWKNTLNSVYTVLDAVEPLVHVDLYELIGIRLDEMTFESLYRLALSKINDSTGFDLAELTFDAVAELTTGKLVSFTSLNGRQAYRMEYAGMADRADTVTIILRLLLKFIGTEDNVKKIEGIIKEKTSMDEKAYAFICTFLEQFSQMVSTPDGIDKALYTVYYVFYGLHVGAHAGNDWHKEFNSNWQFFFQLLEKSDVKFLKDFGETAKKVMDSLTKDIIDGDGLASNGLIKFFKKIAELLNKIIAMLKGIFGK